MKQLYRDLDVPPDASPADIKRAYRRAARAHHPDMGGDPDEFHRANRAYQILADPELRRHYDETGETDPDGFLQRVRGSFANIVFEALENDVPDPAAAIRRQFQESEHQIRADERKIRRRLEKQHALAGRFTCLDDEPDHLAEAHQARLAQIQAELDNLATIQRFHAALRRELDRYRLKGPAHPEEAPDGLGPLRFRDGTTSPGF